MSRYETGVIANIPSDKIEALAEVLKVTPSYLMGWENASGEQDLGLTVLDVAKWLNADTEVVEAVMDSMGWPDATNPETLSKISAAVTRRELCPHVSDDTIITELLEAIGKMSNSELRVVLAVAKQVIAERQ